MAVLLLSSSQLGASSHPNVIVVMTDDQGYGDVGLHGNRQIETPHLDRFARDGIQLTRFYCSPVCAPTRASLMTGRYYYRTGVIHTSRGGAKMHGDEVTLAEYLARAGYRTGIFGKWHLGDNYPMRPQDQGFHTSLVHRSGGIGQTPDRPDSYFHSVLWADGKRVKAKGYCTDVFFDAAMKFIEENRERRFFVYLPTNAPHTPLEVSPKYSDPYQRAGLNETTAKVYGMVTNIDDNFGRLLKRLEELRLRENTLVIFLTDNGPQQRRFTAGLRGRKGSTYEGGIRVPCFVQWPARLEGGRKIDRIAAHVDIVPTVLDVVGQASNLPRNKRQAGSLSHFDGVSLLPLLKGDEVDWADRRLYFQCHRGLTPRLFQNCAVVTQGYKLIGYPGTFSREDLDTTAGPVLELYDLGADPGEKNDLAKSHGRIVRELQTAYQAWFANVRRTRNFTPGLIHVGNKSANPTRLCRYQDGTYRDGKPSGWSVALERTGRYRLTINRGSSKGPGTLHVSWQGKNQMRDLASGATSGVFDLAEGKGVLDVWFVEQGRKRATISDNSTVGDVDVELLKRLQSEQGRSGR